MLLRLFIALVCHLVAVLILCTKAWPGLFEMITFFTFGMFFFAFVAAIVCAVVVAWRQPTNRPRRTSDYVVGSVSTALAYAWVIAFLADLPLRIGLELNRAELEAFHQEVQQMQPTGLDCPVSCRRWVGMYHITDLAVGENGDWMAETGFGYGMFLDWHFYGFVYSAKQAPWRSHITGNWYVDTRKSE